MRRSRLLVPGRILKVAKMARRYLETIAQGPHQPEPYRLAHLGARDSAAELRKRLLIVGNFLSGAVGTRWICEELELKLKETGWAVITTSDKLNRAARLADMLMTTWRCRHEYDVAQIDVYSGPSFIWAEAVSTLLRVLGKPYVVTLHGGALPEFSGKWKRRVTHFLRSATMVTSPSPYVASEMAVYREDILWVPNALDLSGYCFEHRRNLRPSLIWLRAFHPIYNPGMVPEILESLKHDYPDVTIKMIGPVKDKGCLRDMQRKAEALGVAERINIVGAVPKHRVATVIAEGDIFVNTTNFDSAPVSVLEAMSCGLCAVSTDVGGMPYLIENEGDGLLVPPRDPVAMTEAIRRLLSEPDLAAEISKNARLKAEQFAWARVLPRWEELFTSAMHG